MTPNINQNIASFEGSHALTDGFSDKGSVKMKMSVEQWWNDTDRGKLKYWGKNIIQRGW